jgi:hypothetical protein
MEMKGGTTLRLADILEEARGRENHRFKGDDDMDRISKGYRARGLQGRAANEDTRKCYNCNEVGHISRDCKKEKKQQTAKCFNCGKPGHQMRECQGEKMEPSCFHCGTKGHISKVCLSKCGKTDCDWVNCKAAMSGKGAGPEKNVKWGKGLKMSDSRGKAAKDVSIRVAMDSGASFSAFNDIAWFEAGTMRDANEAGMKSIIGETAESKGTGTVSFMISDGNGEWKQVRIEGAAYIPDFEEPLISEIQFRRIHGHDVQRPAKTTNGDLPIIVEIDGRGLEILPDATDNLYYVEIRKIHKEDEVSMVQNERSEVDDCATEVDHDKSDEIRGNTRKTGLKGRIAGGIKRWARNIFRRGGNDMIIEDVRTRGILSRQNGRDHGDGMDNHHIPRGMGG